MIEQFWWFPNRYNLEPGIGIIVLENLYFPLKPYLHSFLSYFMEAYVLI